MNCRITLEKTSLINLGGGISLPNFESYNRSVTCSARITRSLFDSAWNIAMYIYPHCVVEKCWSVHIFYHFIFSSNSKQHFLLWILMKIQNTSWGIMNFIYLVGIKMKFLTQWLSVHMVGFLYPIISEVETRSGRLSRRSQYIILYIHKLILKIKIY